MLPSLRPAIPPKRATPAVITVTADVERRLKELERVTEEERCQLRKRYDDVVKLRRVPDRYFNISYSHRLLASHRSQHRNNQSQADDPNTSPSTHQQKEKRSSSQHSHNSDASAEDDEGREEGESCSSSSQQRHKFVPCPPTAAKQQTTGTASSSTSNKANTTASTPTAQQQQQRIIQGPDRRATEPKKPHAIIKKLKLPKGVITDRSGLLAATARIRTDTGVSPMGLTSLTPRGTSSSFAGNNGGGGGGGKSHNRKKKKEVNTSPLTTRSSLPPEGLFI